MKVSTHLPINTSKADVWKIITDITSFEKIISDVEKIEILNEPSSELKGLKWRETRMYFGKPTAIDKWITDAVANEFYKTRAEMDGFIFLTTLSISENAHSTILTSTHETISQGFMAKLKSLPMIFFRGILKKAILKDLTEIKFAVENK
jgi:hypothetical protein